MENLNTSKFELNGSQENSALAIRKKLALIGRRKVKNILLVQPIQVSEKKLDIRVLLNKRYYMFPPYALGILNTILKKNNYNASIIDLNFEVFNYVYKNKNCKVDELTDKWKSVLKKKLKDHKPDIVGIGCTFTMNHENMMEIFNEVKNFDKSIITVAGGVHVSNTTELVLKEGKNIDFAATYEAEKSFINFLDYINGDKDVELGQISLFLDNKYYQIKKRSLPDGDDINVIPDFDEMDLSKLTDIGEIGAFRAWRPKNSKASAVLSNKGCRARCSFCSVRSFNGKGVRAKSVQTVIDEIAELKEKYGINHISWLDDDLFYDAKRTLDLFNGIVKKNFNITWDASNGIIASAAVAHPELLDASEKSGCIGAYFGVESGNDITLAKIHKPSGVKHYLKLGELMKKYPKIFTKGFLIIGFPDEKMSQILDTINMAKQMALDWFTVHPLTPLPSTEIYDQMVEAGKIEKGKLDLGGENVGYMYAARLSERQRLIEEKNKEKSQVFANLLNLDKDHIPTRKELNDLWFLADYDINYKPIFKQEDGNKLLKLESFLTDISDRMTRNNPLSNYFLSIVKKKLNKNSEGESRMQLSNQYLNNSSYWQQRFKTLNLN